MLVCPTKQPTIDQYYASWFYDGYDATSQSGRHDVEQTFKIDFTVHFF